METIKLPVYGIVVELDGKGAGTITCPMWEPIGGNDRDTQCYSAALDGLESLILAHACAGINVASQTYCDGILTAVDKIQQFYD